MKDLIFSLLKVLVKLKLVTPYGIAYIKFMYKMHKVPHFKNPRDLNEKINYLKFYGDTTMWPMLSDKYKVREYIESLGLGHTLVKLYGKWKDARNIDWDALPDQFILKCNNGTGDVYICKDKNSIDKEKITHYFNRMLKRDFGEVAGEPHYTKIKPYIIAEELLDSTTQPCNSSSLVDYKIWCFNGEPFHIWCFYDRQKNHALEALFDLEWNPHPQYFKWDEHYAQPKETLPKPKCLNEMLEIAKKLSKGFPEVRVDLYEVNGRVYFGELTFSSNGGYDNGLTQEYSNMLGDLIKL